MIAFIKANSVDPDEMSIDISLFTGIQNEKGYTCMLSYIVG